MKKPFELNADYQPDTFEFEDQDTVSEILSRYPDHAKKSAVMPLLDMAQRQVAKHGEEASPPYGGWIPRAAMDKIADIIGQPKIRVYEVATFYSMYNLAPVGKYLVQVCSTTPCWLRGSDDVIKTCKSVLNVDMGETTKDGLFTLIEVECLGACVNAPMIQINDNYYEDLDGEKTEELLTALRDGKEVPVGSQSGRKCSMAVTGPTTLEEEAKKAGVV